MNHFRSEMQRRDVLQQGLELIKYKQTGDPVPTDRYELFQQSYPNTYKMLIEGMMTRETLIKAVSKMPAPKSHAEQD